MRFGIDVAQQRQEFDEIVERVRFGEDLGFDGAWGFDHFVPMYGEGPGNCFEGMTTLAALATATSRIRLGLLVTGATYRHPSVLTAEAITVDHASHGRLELALGAAWYEDEHRQLGIEFPATGRRFDRLEDTLEIVTALCSGEEVSYQGKCFSLNGAWMRPQPVQRPHPPLWIGGGGRRRTLPLAARFADVWHCFGDPTSMAEMSGVLDGLAVAAGRDPSDILRASSLSIEGSTRRSDGTSRPWLRWASATWSAAGRPGAEVKWRPSLRSWRNSRLTLVHESRGAQEAADPRGRASLDDDLPTQMKTRAQREIVGVPRRQPVGVRGTSASRAVNNSGDGPPTTSSASRSAPCLPFVGAFG